MSSQTSLVTKSCRLQQWAVQINECQNRPKAMTVDEWCNQHVITNRFFPNLVKFITKKRFLRLIICAILKIF